MLDASNIPYTSSLQQLVARFGVKKSSDYDWNVVEIATATPLWSRQVGPVWCNVIGVESDLLPPDQFATFIGGTPDASANHAWAVAELTRLIGDGTPNRTASNTFCHNWQQGAISLQVITWPPDRNPDNLNPSHVRHPGLETYAHLYFAYQALAVEESFDD